VTVRPDVAVRRSRGTTATLLLQDRKTGGADPAQRAWAAIILHAWYTAMETTVERVCRPLDGEVPSGADTHRPWLHQAALEQPGIRPALVMAEALQSLLGRLAFRRSSRNAYAVEPGGLAQLNALAVFVDASSLTTSRT
jgi:hypothetical protein